MIFDPEMTNVAAVAGEVTLFRAVIARAFHDALNPRAADGRAAEGEARKARKLRDDARAWLLSDDDDFTRVCELALLDPGAVRHSARRAIESCDAGGMPVAA